MIYEIGNCNEEEAREAFSKDHIAVLPVSAIEVHGNHMPCSTDILLATGVVKKIVRKLKADVILLPTIEYGQVWSLGDFPGSLNVTTPVLTQFIADIGRSLYRHGTRTFILFQGHLGNAPAVKAASRIFYDEFPDMKVFVFGSIGIDKAFDVLTTPRSHKTYLHGCEIETSMLMYLHPDKVDLSKAVVNYPDYPPDFDFTPSPWSTVTKTAVLGDPTAATVEKGKALVEAAVDNISTILNGYWEEKDKHN